MTTLNLSEIPERREQQVIPRKNDALGDYPDDEAAAAAGVPIGGFYRNGSQLMVRTT